MRLLDKKSLFGLFSGYLKAISGLFSGYFRTIFELFQANFGQFSGLNLGPAVLLYSLSFLLLRKLITCIQNYQIKSTEINVVPQI